MPGKGKPNNAGQDSKVYDHRVNGHPTKTKKAK